MDRKQHQKQFLQFFELDDVEDLATTIQQLCLGSIGHALDTVNELRLWPDDADSVSIEQAALCWVIIQKLRDNNFPTELRM